MSVCKCGAAVPAASDAGLGAEGDAQEEGHDAATPCVPGMVGRSEPMRALFANIRKVAASETSVHIFGETGTGKEGAARAIHALSARARAPFVPVNAASLAGELFDSLVFGHVKGSFSGAVNDHPGYVAEAEGGTLFVDEVADLSPTGQARLLRFLQEKAYRRVGDTRDRKANVRVLSATNIALHTAVSSGRFREDLMYRFGSFQLSLPPLRDRGEDILLLARHLLRRVAERDQVAVPGLPAGVAEVLRAYSWPGNVREMENEMNRLIVLSRGRSIQREDLSAAVRADVGPTRRRALAEARSDFEREHLQEALRRSEGNRTRAALELGITRQALYGKLRRFGI